MKCCWSSWDRARATMPADSITWCLAGVFKDKLIKWLEHLFCLDFSNLLPSLFFTTSGYSHILRPYILYTLLYIPISLLLRWIFNCLKNLCFLLFIPLAYLNLTNFLQVWHLQLFLHIFRLSFLFFHLLDSFWFI